MRTHRGAGLAGGLTVAGLLLTACGGSGDGAYGAGTKTDAAATGSQPVPAASDPAGAAPSGQAGNWTKVAVTDDATLGKIVVDGRGWTLYRFDGDTAKPPATHCAAACAKLWPPALWTGKVQATGFAGAAFGKIKRPDGSWQLTLAGWPLYRYAKDTAPGDTTGQGIGGKWFAAEPTGKKATSGSGSSGSGGSTSGYGY